MKYVTNVLRKFFASGTTNRDACFLVWAKTEYGKDWRFAYQHLVDTNGKKPTRGVHY